MLLASEAGIEFQLKTNIRSRPQSFDLAIYGRINRCTLPHALFCPVCHGVQRLNFCSNSVPLSKLMEGHKIQASRFSNVSRLVERVVPTRSFIAGFFGHLLIMFLSVPIIQLFLAASCRLHGRVNYGIDFIYQLLTSYR